MYFLEICFIQLSFVDDLNGDLGKQRKRQNILVKLAFVKCTMPGFRTKAASSINDWHCLIDLFYGAQKQLRFAHLAFCDAVSCQFHHREVAFTNGLLDVVKSNFNRPLSAFRRHFRPCIRRDAPVKAKYNAFERQDSQGNALFIWQRHFASSLCMLFICKT